MGRTTSKEFNREDMRGLITAYHAKFIMTNTLQTIDKINPN